MTNSSTRKIHQYVSYIEIMLKTEEMRDSRAAVLWKLTPSDWTDYIETGYRLSVAGL